MYLEYDWVCCCYRPRLGGIFTSIDGCYSFMSLDHARQVLAACGLRLGAKTDTRTWAIEGAAR